MTDKTDPDVNKRRPEETMNHIKMNIYSNCSPGQHRHETQSQDTRDVWDAEVMTMYRLDIMPNIEFTWNGILPHSLASGKVKVKAKFNPCRLTETKKESNRL